ncbi:MAG: hypothetical protein E8D45_00900 [Nitrospira sp.]|nr:MAG: hypothetical protein E8D45_00900 [Nitrospira sp.]
MRRRTVLISAALLWGCGVAAMSANLSASGLPRDGELPFPAEYQTWPRFLTNIDKVDTKQVRDIYLNPTGAKAKPGEMFPDETTMVMEIYKAKESASGELDKSSDGKLAKDKLAKVFVMSKKQGWGQDAPDHLKNGAWVFSAFGPDGKPLAEDFTKCRACHAPLAQKDFVHRYDEYFEARMKR